MLGRVLAMPVAERKKISDAAVKHVRKNFTTELMTSRTPEVYEEVIANDELEDAPLPLPTQEETEKVEKPPEKPYEKLWRFLKPSAKSASSDPAQAGKGKKEHILVVRFGALGDMIMCRQAFQDIRQAHKDAEIALLTTPPFESFAKSMPWFDKVIAAERAPFWQVGKWISLLVQLYSFAPKRVYDLQGRLRQSIMFMLMGGPLWGPKWSGAAPGCSHPRPWAAEAGNAFRRFSRGAITEGGRPASFQCRSGVAQRSSGWLYLAAAFCALYPRLFAAVAA